ncbi:glycerol-3-phosphate dehydrogenase/oxidase [Mycetocola manganoxydans]|uniref:Glycerol-3-phosphate dehydrogenase/oxidase n=1 Tax=Mycetocola manganoxydans TaxID=699879 RepID=A0A3L7A1M6_9MICO|nr:glycerol-3-phosphate dehydrogenase/oxidase [Mycetocola manganoxydans]RLP73930.1 glycerol-3-phosphate dehydrogenase/oxidase [Mycetocola manganoxydans]GHD42271.1 glycerol-3-phosphate dehydrogenase [Mycetocola manganoxydans]
MKQPATQPGNRRASVDTLRNRPNARVLVIGGGINGLAVFRDLALQGVDVALVERGDYCSGASAASSHMIHGGIRYLENGEFRLVKESVTERNGLLKIAPHYVKPLETTVPIFSTFSGIVSAPLRFLTHKSGKPQERGALLIKVGLTLYDFFSRDGGTVPRHRFFGKKKALAALPKLNDDLKYTATYFDASVHDPERLALDVLRDGLDAGPHARAANYVEAVGFEGGSVLLRDGVSGDEFAFDAEVVINASGPWTDLTNAALGQDSSLMGGTKGSHIVLDNPDLLAATGGREIFFEHEDGRIVLIYPLKGKVMVGTTDIDADPAEPAVCTEEEVDYFFDLVKHVFPSISVSRDEIVYRFSGIRPLPGHGDLEPGFVSRDYRIVPTPLGAGTMLSLVGGKWTTFRALAEHLSTETLALLGAERTVSTVGMPIGGGAGFPSTDAAMQVWLADNSREVGRARATQLMERYGTRATGIIEELGEAGEDRLVSAPDYSVQEITRLIRTEHVVHLLDLLQRRTSIAFTGGVTSALLEELTPLLADALGWTGEQADAEIAAARATLRTVHGVQFDTRPVVTDA